MYSVNTDYLFKKCPRCGKKPELSWTYCGYCGHNLSESFMPGMDLNTVICPKCSKRCHKSLSHCPSCGAFLPKLRDSFPDSPIYPRTSARATSTEAINFRLCPKCHDILPLGQILCPKCDVILPHPLQTPPISPKTIHNRACPKCHVSLEKEQTHCFKCGQFVPDFIWPGHDFDEAENVVNPRIPSTNDVLIHSILDEKDNSEICFIATACDSDAMTLGTFYDFRDQVLLKSKLGQKFVNFYYQHAPKAADFIRPFPLLKQAILNGLLKPLACMLRWLVLPSSGLN